MTLMDRAFIKGSIPKLSNVNSSDLDALKFKVSRILPPMEIARLIARNPNQARNEIRLTCEKVLDEEPWLAPEALSKSEAIESYLDEVFGFGPLETMLADESITEIMVNGSNSLYYEKEGRLFESESCFDNDAQVYALIDKIVGPLGRRVDESSPMVNARLKQGHRVNAVIPPLALDGPVVTIRKFRSHIFSLDEMRELGSFDDQVAVLMKWAVLRRCNIAVSGGTGSGKTTLLNALSSLIPPGERIVTIEDSAELRFTEHPHVVRLEARQRNAEGVGEVTIRDLVINSLRMRPDRIVVGECRGAEALDMLQAMGTGHDGSLTTLHANSPEEAVSRLTTMVRYGAELPVEIIEAQIANAIDLVVQTTRYPNGRRGVCEVSGYEWDKTTSECAVKCYFRKDAITGEVGWLSFPAWLDDLPYLRIATKGEVAEWKHRASCC